MATYLINYGLKNYCYQKMLFNLMMRPYCYTTSKIFAHNSIDEYLRDRLRCFFQYTVDRPSENNRNISLMESFNTSIFLFTRDEDEFKKSFVNLSPDVVKYFKSWEFRNCFSVAEALRLLSENWFRAQLNEYTEVNILQFKINGEIKAEDVDLSKITGFERKNNLLITFECINDESSKFFCWKNSNTVEFAFLNLTKNQPADLTLFVKSFLQTNLKSIRSLVPTSDVSIIDLVDSKGRNLLMKAIELEETTIFEDLKRFPFDMSQETENGQTAVDIAWNKEDQDVVYELLNANSPYPKKFKIEMASPKIKEFLSISIGLHEIISSDETSKVEEVLTSNPNLRYFYDSKNTSACAVAMNEGNVEIYEILTAKNVTFGPKEDIFEVFERVEDMKKKEIKNIHDRRAVKLPEKHVMILISKSSVGYDDSDCTGRLNHIRDAFMSLNEIFLFNLIMKIVATCKKLKIFFDFKRTSVHFMDPYKGDRETDGIFYPYTGHVYIAANGLLKPESRLITIATLFHELCHYACNIIFCNGAKPYAIGDEPNARLFEGILEKCKLAKEQEVIVGWVFEYPKPARHAELIVRVPHMIAHYHGNEERIGFLRETFKDLFDFCGENVEAEMLRALPILNKLSSKVNEISFDELTPPLKKKVLHSWVIFQNSSVQLKEIIGDEDSKVLKLLKSKQIRKMLSNETIRIADQDEQDLGQHVDVGLLKVEIDGENGDSTVVSLDDMAARVMDSKVNLLIDIAGTGKSVSLKRLMVLLKGDFRNFWVSKIYLKNYIHAYEKFQSLFGQSREIGMSEIMRVLTQILGLYHDFETELFRELFELNRVILLCDGFDEIAPTYNNFFLAFSAAILRVSHNKLLISSRYHHKYELIAHFSEFQDENDKVYYQVQPFDDIAMKDLIVDILEAKVEYKQRFRLFYMIRSVITSALNPSRVPSQIIKSPQILKMITEICVKDERFVAKFNIYSLYLRVLDEHKYLLLDKGPIVNKDRENVESSMTIYQIHQLYALKNKFSNGTDASSHNPMNLSDFALFKRWKTQQSKWTANGVSRHGMMHVENWESEHESAVFAHSIVEYFFVAQYVVESLYYLDRNDENFDEMEVELRIELLEAIAKEFNGERDSFVWAFIKSFIDEKLKSEVKRKFNPKILKVLKQKSVDSEQNPGGFIKLLFFFSQDEEIVNILLRKQKNHKRFFKNVVRHESCRFDKIEYLIQVFERTYGWETETGFKICGNFCDKIEPFDFVRKFPMEPEDDFISTRDNCKRFLKFLVNNSVQLTNSNRQKLKDFLDSRMTKMINYSMRSLAFSHEFFKIINFVYKNSKEALFDAITDAILHSDFYNCKGDFRFYSDDYLTCTEHFWFALNMSLEPSQIKDVLVSEKFNVNVDTADTNFVHPFVLCHLVRFSFLSMLYKNHCTKEETRGILMRNSLDFTSLAMFLNKSKIKGHFKWLDEEDDKQLLFDFLKLSARKFGKLTVIDNLEGDIQRLTNEYDCKKFVENGEKIREIMKDIENIAMEQCLLSTPVEELSRILLQDNFSSENVEIDSYVLVDYQE